MCHSSILDLGDIKHESLDIIVLYIRDYIASEYLHTIHSTLDSYILPRVSIHLLKPPVKDSGIPTTQGCTSVKQLQYIIRDNLHISSPREYNRSTCSARNQKIHEHHPAPTSLLRNWHRQLPKHQRSE